MAVPLPAAAHHARVRSSSSLPPPTTRVPPHASSSFTVQTELPHGRADSSSRADLLLETASEGLECRWPTSVVRGRRGCDGRGSFRGERVGETVCEFGSEWGGVVVVMARGRGLVLVVDGVARPSCSFGCPSEVGFGDPSMGGRVEVVLLPWWGISQQSHVSETERDPTSTIEHPCELPLLVELVPASSSCPPSSARSTYKTCTESYCTDVVTCCRHWTGSSSSTCREGPSSES